MTTGWAVPGFTELREVRGDRAGRRVLARHQLTRRSVTITYISAEFLADTGFRRRFAADIQRLVRVRDPRVPRVHSYLRHGDHAAVVADRVRGTHLRDILVDEGALGPAAALVVFKDAVRALAAGSAEGVAHGDVKPEYLIVSGAGAIRLVDFGLYTGPARRLPRRSTPFYLAPELWSADIATTAGDLYAATAVFFECLVGAPPFHGADAAALWAAHREGTPPLDTVPTPLRALVRAGLAKDPRGRPDPLRLLGCLEDAALGECGERWEWQGRRELTRLVGDAARAPHTPAHRVSSLGWERRQPVRLAAVLGGAMVLAAGLSSPVLPQGLFRMPNGAPGEGRPPVMAFPGPADNAGLQSDTGRHASEPETGQARSVLLGDSGSAAPAVVRSPSPRQGAGPAASPLVVHPADLVSAPSPRSVRPATGPESGAPSGRSTPAEATRQEAVRQEAARHESARHESARNESARQEAARNESARQEAARNESAGREADRDAAARQGPRDGTARSEATHRDDRHPRARTAQEYRQPARATAQRQDQAEAVEKAKVEKTQRKAQRAQGADRGRESTPESRTSGRHHAVDSGEAHRGGADRDGTDRGAREPAPRQQRSGSTYSGEVPHATSTAPESRESPTTSETSGRTSPRHEKTSPRHEATSPRHASNVPTPAQQAAAEKLAGSGRPSATTQSATPPRHAAGERGAQQSHQASATGTQSQPDAATSGTADAGTGADTGAGGTRTGGAQRASTGTGDEGTHRTSGTGTTGHTKSGDTKTGDTKTGHTKSGEARTGHPKTGTESGSRADGTRSGTGGQQSSGGEDSSSGRSDDSGR